MTRILGPFLDKLPYIGRLRRRVELEGMFPAGHYYSPIPDRADVLSYISSRTDGTGGKNGLPDVEMNRERQFRMLEDFLVLYEEMPFPETKSQDYRYFFKNNWYSYADAIFLYSFLRRHNPGKIIEVGSGFSSAVMLDTIDGFFDQRPALTLIEPDPSRLEGLLRRDDEKYMTLMDRRLQDVPMDLFAALGSGDLLFIDSSHVMKCGSDLQKIMFAIMPALRQGVFVHFHDVFYPFDYPSEWLAEGRYWNENYFLRAFLAYNSEWSIEFFNAYVACEFEDFIRRHMPLCQRNPGGSLYLRRTGKGC